MLSFFVYNVAVDIEFYLKSDVNECQNAYLGNISTSSPDAIDVINPWLDSTICKNFKNNKNLSGEYVSNYENIGDDNAKKLLVPECFNDTVEFFSDIESGETRITERTISEKIQKASEIYNISRAGVKLSDGLQCHYHEDGSLEGAEETIPFNYNPYNATYWYASCYETTKVTYDQPKKVISGAGFPYQAVVEVTRTCTPVPIVVTPPKKCSYTISCWGGPANHKGESGAGPNEDFDSCVTSCDGGEYTQACIDQCYKNVYESDENKTDKMAYNSFLDVMKNYLVSDQDTTSSVLLANNDFSDIINCSNYDRSNAPTYCYKIKEISYTDYEKRNKKDDLGRYIVNVAATESCRNNTCKSLHGLKFGYYETCDANEESGATICYEVYNMGKMNKKSDPYCSDNRLLDYEVELARSEREYTELMTAIQEYVMDETFKVQIVDSYKKEDGKLLTVSYKETAKELDTSLLKIDGGLHEYDDGKTYKVVNTDYDVVYAKKTNTEIKTKNLNTVEVKKAYTVNLPKAYISQFDSQERYVDINEIKNEYERDGGNKYYTDIKSGTYNDYINWSENYYPNNGTNIDPKTRTGNNISVTFNNLGTEQEEDNYTWESIPIDCFYGVLNQRYIECEDNICDNTCNPETDICTGGLQYYFRQINLNDVFPNRSPRWNWTSYASVYDSGYAVNPVEVTEQIERDGNSILTDTPDYEITLTRENIREIRSKNKGLNYQEYFDGMTCDLVNGMEVCKSNIDSSVDSIIRNTELGENE